MGRQKEELTAEEKQEIKESVKKSFEDILHGRVIEL
jgi:hypothetical protein